MTAAKFGSCLMNVVFKFSKISITNVLAAVVHLVIIGHHVYLYIYFICSYISSACANNAEKFTILVLRRFLWFLTVPQIVRLFSNAKSSA